MAEWISPAPTSSTPTAIRSRSQDLLDREPRTFETRCMFLGTALISSNHANLEAAAFVEELTETTMFGLALRRWIARAPRAASPRRTRSSPRATRPCAPTRPDTSAGCWSPSTSSRSSPTRGTRSPRSPVTEFESALGGVPVHRVGRIEPWIVEAREEGTFDGTVQRFEETRERRRGRPTVDRVQDDHRLSHRAGHHGSVDVGRRRGVRSVAGRRLARDPGARQAGPRLPAASRVRRSRRNATACSTCTSARAIPT